MSKGQHSQQGVRSGRAIAWQQQLVAVDWTVAGACQQHCV